MVERDEKSSAGGARTEFGGAEYIRIYYCGRIQRRGLKFTGAPRRWQQHYRGTSGAETETMDTAVAGYM